MVYGSLPQTFTNNKNPPLKSNDSTILNIQLYAVTRFKENFPSREELAEQVERESMVLCKQLCDDFPLVLCHHDPHMLNIIYNPHKGMSQCPHMLNFIYNVCHFQ